MWRVPRESDRGGDLRRGGGKQIKQKLQLSARRSAWVGIIECKACPYISVLLTCGYFRDDTAFEKHVMTLLHWPGANSPPNIHVDENIPRPFWRKHAQWGCSWHDECGSASLREHMCATRRRSVAKESEERRSACMVAALCVCMQHGQGATVC